MLLGHIKKIITTIMTFLHKSPLDKNLRASRSYILPSKYTININILVQYPYKETLAYSVMYSIKTRIINLQLYDNVFKKQTLLGVLI